MSFFYRVNYKGSLPIQRHNFLKIHFLVTVISQTKKEINDDQPNQTGVSRKALIKASAVYQLPPNAKNTPFLGHLIHVNQCLSL